jgi:hypothetical protein
MADHILASIAEENFADFQKMIPELRERAPTYKDWEECHSTEKLKRERDGQKVREVPVHPREFRTYCRSGNQVPSLHVLWLFAREKASPRQAISDYDPLNDA